MRLAANASLPVSRWHNGAGRKADIATGDGWLTGFAWLDGDAPFSSLVGYDRTITLVQGPGFMLDITGRDPLVVQGPFQPAPFDGGAPTTCRITGPSRVLNVMTARDRFRHRITITGAGGRVAAEGVVARILVLLRGVATVADAVQLDGVAQVEASADAVLADILIDRAGEGSQHG